jgi:ParB/RepB/Spo0J family partition protein
VGVLVPITVYHDGRRSSTPYVLLDGERRLRAAKQINRATIPALVVPRPSPKENAVRMFNIHMLREDWREIETAWALEEIMNETGVRDDRDLQQLTGLSVDRIRNMKRVLDFPKSWQQRVAREEIPYQLLVELDKNVLSRRRNELEQSSDAVLELSVPELRDIFLKKYVEGVETDIVDLRRVGTLLDTAKSDGKVAQRARLALQSLVENPTATIEEAYETGAASSVELSKVMRDVAALPGRLSDLLSSRLDTDQKREVLRATRELQRRLNRIVKQAK